jgi:DNA-binding response OmpR family regulator
MKSLNVLFLEDHEFFSEDIVEYFKDEGHKVTHAKTYADAVKAVENNNYDVSIIDVILQNGKTGIHFVSNFQDKLGTVRFLTGCIDQPTIDKISKWGYYNKRDEVFTKLDKLISDIK